LAVAQLRARLLDVPADRDMQGIIMAGEGHTEITSKAHSSSYNLFVGMMKWGTIISFIVAAIVVLIIAS
jgi:hypothetical protein